jgi:HEAT repeat protein
MQPFRQLETWMRQDGPDHVLRSQLEGAFTRLLAPTSTFEARRFACKQLGVIGSDLSLAALAPVLKEESTVGIACLALTAYPPGKADEILRTNLASATGTIKLQLIRAVGDRHAAMSFDVLGAAVRDPDPAIASAAIISIGKIGGLDGWRLISTLRETAKPNLLPAFSDAYLRCGASLAALGDRKTATAIYESLLGNLEPDHIRRGAFAALTRLDTDQGQQRIVTIIRTGDPVLKPLAISCVRDLHASNASAVFAREMHKLQPNEQVWMIQSLAARNDPDARSAVGKCVASSAPTVRLASIDALGHIGDSHTVGLLAGLLRKSPAAEETRAIESALVSVGGGTTTDDAVRSELKKSTGAARATLIDVYSQRLGPAANPILLVETGNPDSVIAKSAYRALARTAQPAELPALLQKLSTINDPSVRAEAENAASLTLARIDDVSSRSSAVTAALAQAKFVEARCSLLGLLPGCGDTAALDALKAAAGDSDPRTREAAVEALADWPDASAWKPLADLYRKPPTEPLRGTALRGLVRIVGEENSRADSHLAERYMELLQGAHSDSDLKLILGALGGAARPETLQLAVPLLSNPGVRPEATVAVRKIAEAIKVKYPVAAKEALDKLETPK